MSKKLPIPVGQVFGHLTVICEGEPLRQGREVSLTCRCVCGKIRDYYSHHVRSGRQTDCGCKRVPSRLDHGYCGTITHNSWLSMRRRCKEPGNKEFAKYSKIGYADEFDDFATFLAYMGERPSVRHTLDRIDNSQGYVRGNMRWATWETQQRNRTNNRMIVCSTTGETKLVTLVEACELAGISNRIVITRLCTHKWPITRALGADFSWPDGVNPYTNQVEGRQPACTTY